MQGIIASIKHLIHFEIVFWMEQKIKKCGFLFFLKKKFSKKAWKLAIYGSN